LLFAASFQAKSAYWGLADTLGGSGGLKDRAAGRLLAGTAVYYAGLKNEAAFRNTVLANFNLVTPEVELVFSEIYNGRYSTYTPQYNFTQPDYLLSFAQSNNLKLLGHPLVWGFYLPDLVARASAAQLYSIYDQHIAQLVSRYKDRRNANNEKTIYGWVVVNEPTATEPGSLVRTDSIWGEWLTDEERLGFIKHCFDVARVNDPEARLLLNEYVGYLGNPDWEKLDLLTQIVDRLLALGAPLDGVGLQAHVTATEPDVAARITTLSNRLAEMSGRYGRALTLHVTEMDVRFQDCQGTEEQQVENYRSALAACLAAGNCASFATWGVSDKDTWYRGCN
jgi:endo-1,4-beta-xylanase